jgi:flagellar biosynthesis protein FlhF
MEIKRYRAATMREALEQIKQDLGEDALVLDTKRVKAGGFLGVGTQELIEVRAALGLASATPKRTENRPKTPNAGLDLTDNSPALPTVYEEPAKKETLTSSPSPQAYTKNAGQLKADKTGERLFNNADFNGIEIADTEPKFVYSHPTTTPPANASTPQTTAGSPSNTSPTVTRNNNNVSRELEHLRAELKEIKFSLNALTLLNQQNQRPSNWYNQSNTSPAFDAEPEMFDSPYYEIYLSLTSTGLAPEIARQSLSELIKSEIEENAEVGELAKMVLTNSLPSLIDFALDPLNINLNPTGTLPTIAFIGPTGVGKTTTIAKLAARVALRERRRVELITLDTYRIAAVEQLKTYAEIIGAGCHIARSIVELDALRQRFEENATILIDTIGRSPHDLADQMELADYLRESEDICKCLVMPANLHPIDAQVVAKKFGLYGASHLVLTKLDETIRPGASINIINDASLPLVYLCTGQRVPEDLEQATPENFASRILNISR